MILKTPRLTLRPFIESDWQEVHSYASNPKVCEFIEWGPNQPFETREFLRRVVRSAKENPRISYDFAVVSPDQNRIIGNIGLYLTDLQRRKALLGYVFMEECWGQGFASEVASVVIAFGFADLNLDYIAAMCDVRNVASARVLEKCGMLKEGLALKDKLVKGRWRNTLTYSISSLQWRGANSSACEPAHHI